MRKASNAMLSLVALTVAVLAPFAQSAMAATVLSIGDGDSISVLAMIFSKVEFPRFRGQVLELHTNDCRGRRKALLVIDWTEETDR